MKLWQDWSSYRRFQNLPSSDRNIVFYSESHQDWHHLQPLIEFLIERLSRTVCHVTSEQAAPVPPVSRPGLHAFRIRPGAVCIWFFQALKADVMVLTMLDLQNFQLKRSIHPVRYAYVFHSMGSTHMVDHENSYDHYDSLLCTGPHHVAEIRRREQLKSLPPKHLFAYGYPRLERLVALAASHPREASTTTTALLAPTWGEHSILHVCGESLIATLLEAGIHVILRPHYQTARLAPRLVQSLVARFGGDPRFRHVDRMEESASLLESDLSTRPAPHAQRGAPDAPAPARSSAMRTISRAPSSTLRPKLNTHSSRSAALREEWVFNFGRSVEAGAREIARLADERAGAGASGTPR